jgi:hypothetical protein
MTTDASTDAGTIAVPAAEVRALGVVLGQLAGDADDAGARLTPEPGVGPSLRAAVEDFLACHRTAAAALAGELRWLGSAVTAVAASWEALDGALLGPGGRAEPR